MKLKTPPRNAKWHETAATVYDRGRHRPILVAIVPSLILFRVKGDSVVHSVTYGAALDCALRIEHSEAHHGR